MKNINLDLSIEDTNLVLEALGALPFARVYALIGRIQETARQQLEAETAGANGSDRTNGSGANGSDREHGNREHGSREHGHEQSR